MGLTLLIFGLLSDTFLAALAFNEYQSPARRYYRNSRNNLKNHFCYIRCFCVK